MEYTNNPIMITVTGIPHDGEDAVSEKVQGFDKNVMEMPCKGFAIIAFRDSDEDHVDCAVSLHEVSVAMLASVMEDSEALADAARLCTLKGTLGLRGLFGSAGKN